MASATPLCPSNKEKDNFARLCCVLIEVGPLVLTDIFNKVCSPEDLNSVLKDETNHRKLLSLRNEGALSGSQWLKLYPKIRSSSVSSRDFDPSLQLLLLRSIFGPHLSASCQDNFPSATDTSPIAGFTRIKVLRDRIHHHATSGSVDDPTFSSYWSEITKTFLCFGGDHHLNTIKDLKVESLDEDLREEYRKQLREWMRDDAFSEDELGEGRIVKKARKGENMEGSIGISEQISGREGMCNTLVDTESLSYSGVSTMFDNFSHGSLKAKYAPENLRISFPAIKTATQCFLKLSTNVGKPVVGNPIIWNLAS